MTWCHCIIGNYVMVSDRKGEKKVWVNQSHPVTSAGGTFLACRAWIKLTWASAQVPFSHTEGESEICQQYVRKSGEEKWEQLADSRGCRNRAESTRELLMCPVHCWAWAAPSLFGHFLLLKDSQERFQQNPVGAQIPRQFEVSLMVSVRKY